MSTSATVSDKAIKESFTVFIYLFGAFKVYSVFLKLNDYFIAHFLKSLKIYILKAPESIRYFFLGVYKIF